MKKIVLLLMVITALYSSDYTYEFSGHLDITGIQDKASMSKEKENEISNTLAVDIIFNNDFYFDNNSKFVFSGGFMSTSAPMYNTVVKDKVTELNSYYINELYYTKGMTDNLYLSLGQFTFRKGSFYEYSFNGNRLGNGLYNLIDVNLQGGILTYKDEDKSISIGRVNFDKYYKSFYDTKETEDSVTYDSYKDSGMEMVIIKNKGEKLYTELNIYRIQQFVNDINIINSRVIGLGMSYDDKAESGIVGYGILSFTKSKGNTTSLSPTGSELINETMHFGKFESHGYSYLVGSVYDVDDFMFNKDFQFGVEYGYRSPGFHSLLAGRPLAPYAYSDVGYTYGANVGIRLNKDNIIKIIHSTYDSDGKTTKYGLTPSTTSNNNFNTVDKVNTLIVQWYMDF